MIPCAVAPAVVFLKNFSDYILNLRNFNIFLVFYGEFLVCISQPMLIVEILYPWRECFFQIRCLSVQVLLHVQRPRPLGRHRVEPGPALRRHLGLSSAVPRIQARGSHQAGWCCVVRFPSAVSNEYVSVILVVDVHQGSTKYHLRVILFWSSYVFAVYQFEGHSNRWNY